MLNIAKVLTREVAALVGRLRLPVALGLTPAMQAAINHGNMLYTAAHRSLLEPSLIIGDYALAACLSLPEYIIVSEIRPTFGFPQKRGGVRAGSKGVSSAAALRRRGAI